MASWEFRDPLFLLVLLLLLHLLSTAPAAAQAPTAATGGNRDVENAPSANKLMAEKAELFGPENMRNIEKQLLLQTIDAKWREHLVTLEHLRSVVGFRGYAQRDPLNEYKTEGFQLFGSMLDSLRTDVTKKLSQIRPMSKEEQEQMIAQMRQQQAAAQAAAAKAAAPAAPVALADPEPTSRSGTSACAGRSTGSGAAAATDQNHNQAPARRCRPRNKVPH